MPPRLAVLTMPLLLLSACAVHGDMVDPALDVPAGFRASAASAAAAWPSEDWWKGFGSAELDSLIAQARANNFDIQAAIARVIQADAQVRIASAALLPNLNGSSSGDWQHTGEAASGTRGAGLHSNRSFENRTYGAKLNASYELDFWGHDRAQSLSAEQSASFSRFDQRTVALTVVTQVANTWFAALSLADRLAVARQNVADSERSLAVIKGRLEAGTANALDAANQETLLANQRATIPGLRNQLEQTVIGLGILTGTPPERISVHPATLSTLKLPVVSPGLPSALLERRPDVAAAEAQLAASGFDVTVARTAFYPRISLTGSAGFQAPALNAMFGPGGFIATLVAGLVAPIFDGGSLRGALDQARGRQLELLADYRKSVVQAFTDTDDALTAWRFNTEQEALQRAAVETARRAAAIARAQMLAGTADITAVLAAETALFNAEDTLVQVRLARVQALVALYKALGGGWTKTDVDRFQGLKPGLIEGGVALPVGGNR